MRLIVNFVAFQVAWFACVLGGAHGVPWIGPLVVAILAVAHLRAVPDARAEGLLLLAAALVGTVFDSALVVSGWLAYPSGQWFAWMAPYWIVAMWVAFATTLNVSLDWLKGRMLLAVAFGAAGGPLAYLGGAALGGVVLVDATSALLALGIGWAGIMPLLMALAQRLDGWRPGVGRRPLATAAEGSGHV
ncbi:MAG: DUF2878 domain-containing protein [Gammaproteobacteria bacterium]|nr:DUF2878 domain-containing protein [Gammaproteobacteria bacterium]